MSRISSAERARLSPRERARRKRIASEKMALRLEHEEVFKLVKRMKLTVGDLNNLFDADVWYIKDESSGDVFWPESTASGRMVFAFPLGWLDAIRMSSSVILQPPPHSTTRGEA